MAPDEADAPLKLRAEDADDLAVLSACLQDALVPVRDLAYVPDQRIFVFVANRFRWESPLLSSPGGAARQRILCAVTFSTVDAVSYRGFRRSAEDRILALLAIRLEAAGPAASVIRLEFSGNAVIRLEATRVLCHAKDLGDPWPTQWHPRHDGPEDD
jgi:hypothetical protein